MEAITLELNQWYILNGSPEIRSKIIELLRSNGWKCYELLPTSVPDCIRFVNDIKGKKLTWRSHYNERYMPNAITLECNELLGQLEQVYNKLEEDNMEPTSVQSTKGSRILGVSFRKEMLALEQKCETQINNIKRDNAYVAAINTAIAKINKQLKKDISLQAIGFDVNLLLSEEEHLLIRKTFESIEKEKEALREKYEIAEELLNMADTYKEKKDILDKYTKNVL